MYNDETRTLYAKGKAMWRTITLIWNSVIQGVFEVGLIILPVLLYIIVLVFIRVDSNIWEIPAWSFLAFSLYAFTLRDIVKAYRAQRPIDRFNENGGIVICIIGLGISGVQLCCSIIRNHVDGFLLWEYFDATVFVTIVFGVVFVIVARSTVIQREEGRIV